MESLPPAKPWPVEEDADKVIPEALRNVEIPASRLSREELHEIEDRTRRFLKLGWGDMVSQLFAHDASISIEDAELLAAAGCPPELAMRILPE